MSDNQLTGPIPAELRNLSSLETLNLEFNLLSSPIPTQLGNLNILRWLLLNNNQLSGGIPAELGNLSSLERLHLGNNTSLSSWQTEGALNWARGLELYFGPDAVCP